MSDNKKEILLGNEAIVRGAIDSGVSFVSGYPGCPAAEIGDEFGGIAKENNIYYEQSVNEKVALEVAMGASFSGLKAMVAMKSFGINVCSDALLPLAYTGVKGPMVIVVADDPSCWSSAQSEQNTRGYAHISHIPMLEPSDAQECYDFTKLAYEISEKFKMPVILRTTTRVAHQRMPVICDAPEQVLKSQNPGKFISDKERYITIPPRVLEMKKELLEKIEEIRKYSEKSKINETIKVKNPKKIGIIASGVSYLYAKEAMDELGVKAPVLKLGFFYPLPEQKIKNFIKDLKKVLVVEELEGFVEKELAKLAKDVNLKLEIIGKKALPEIGELDANKVAIALSNIIGNKYKSPKFLSADINKRFPRLCANCPYWFVFSAIKKVAPDGAVFGGDIGCYMIGAYPPHNLHDYMICMGSSSGIGHGIAKSTNQKVITFMGDSTFFHSGMPAIANVVFNKSNPLIVILDNRITAMTGHQVNPGMGKNGMNEDTEIIDIERVVKSLGIKNVKTIDPKNMSEFELAAKELLGTGEAAVLIAKRVCAYWENKLNRKNNE